MGPVSIFGEVKGSGFSFVAVDFSAFSLKTIVSDRNTPRLLGSLIEDVFGVDETYFVYKEIGEPTGHILISIPIKLLEVREKEKTKMFGCKEPVSSVMERVIEEEGIEKTWAETKTAVGQTEHPVYKYGVSIPTEDYKISLTGFLGEFVQGKGMEFKVSNVEFRLKSIHISDVDHQYCISFEIEKYVDHGTDLPSDIKDEIIKKLYQKCWKGVTKFYERTVAI